MVDNTTYSLCDFSVTGTEYTNVMYNYDVWKTCKGVAQILSLHDRIIRESIEHRNRNNHMELVLDHGQVCNCRQLPAINKCIPETQANYVPDSSVLLPDILIKLQIY